MKVIIEEFNEKNIEQIIKMEQELCLFHSLNCKLLSEDKVKNYNYLDYIKGFIDNVDSIFLVAKINDQICGMASVENRKSLELHNLPQEAYVDNLFIIPEFRRLGVASRLVEYAEQYAFEKGIEVLTVKVYDFNKASQSVFGKYGYQKDYSHYSKTIDKK